VFWEEFLKQGGCPKVITAVNYTLNAALDTPGKYANCLVYNDLRLDQVAVTEMLNKWATNVTKYSHWTPELGEPDCEFLC
jgi:hypothetical protein